VVRYRLPRRRYLRDPVKVAVDREVLEQLRRLRLHRGEPIGEVVRRILRAYLSGRIVGY
jgi:hypothetical protein